MITESFDDKTPPITTPAAVYGEQKRLVGTCIVTFSEAIRDHVLERFDCRQITSIRACNGQTPVYLFRFRDREIAFYLSHIGAAGAATDVIEVNWLTGAENFILFGSAGTLDSEKTRGRFVVPDKAYRDEGTSYHYAPPEDYIKIRNSERVAAVFGELQAPFVTGGVWTTDAFYRETRGQFEKRKSEGCIAVDMELAGVQAVCDFHGLELFAFLQAGDALDQPTYDCAGLHEANHDLEKFYLALALAKRIEK